jgi:filamentous hemagglutinin
VDVPINPNPKHVKGGAGNRKNAGIQPDDAEVAFQRYALFDGKNWWAAGANGSLYRYSKTNDNLYHWSGSTKDPFNPLDDVRVPPKIKKMLGVD